MPDVAIPTTADELAEFMADSKKMQSLFNQDGSAKEEFGEFITNYARTVLNKDADLGKQVTEETQRALGNYLREHGADIRKLDLSNAHETAPRGQRKVYNKRAPGVALDNEFDGSSEFFQSIWHKREGLRNHVELGQKLSKIRDVQNSYGSTVPADGGFLVPETLRSEILSVALESSIVRPRARVIPMETLRVPIPSIDESTHVGSVFGGIVCYWTEEGGALVESQAKFGRVVLDAKKLTAYAEAPNELIADASAFMGFFDQTFPQAMAWYEDDAFLNGSGVGMPLGVLKGSGLVTVTQGGTAENIIFADIVNMYSRMLPSSLGTAVWVASIDTFPSLAKLEMTAGSPVVWFNNGVSGAPPATILGRPVVFTEKVPASGSAGQLSLIDFGYYLIGDRQAMQAESSPHYKFANDKTAFRIIERVDGRPWLQTALTPKNGSANTLSPYVTLGASV